MKKLIYGVKYRFSKTENWEWDTYGENVYVHYDDINEAYRHYNRIARNFEWIVEELPEELLNETS